jgi:hypothetical protein
MSHSELKKELRQIFEEYMETSRQSGKQETSNLVSDIIERQKPVIEETIERVVNGRIRELHHKIDDYIKRDEQWKEEITPQIKLVKDVQGFGKVSLYALGFFSAIGGAIMLIINLFKKV